MKPLKEMEMFSPRGWLLATATAALIGGEVMTAPDAKAAFLLFDDDDEVEVTTEAQTYDRRVVGRTYDRRTVYVDPQTLNLPTAEEVGPSYGVAPLQGDIPTSDQSPAVNGNEQADN